VLDMAAVKKEIILSLLFCLFFPAFVSADIITITSGCAGGKVLFKSVPIQTGLACTEATYPGDFDPVAADALEFAKTAYTGGDCSGVRPANLTLDCAVYLVGACCTQNWVNNKNVLEDSIISSGTVTGVAQGSEREAAESYCNQFFNSTPYTDHSAGGYVRTDGLTGYVYTSGMDQGVNTAIVNANCWKRGGYAHGSAVVTMESLGGSMGGTGGLIQTQAQDAFTAALGIKNLSAGEIGTQMNNAWDRAHELGYMNSGGSSGGGLDAAGTTTAVKDALDLKFPDGTFTGVPSLTGSYVIQNPAKEFSESFGDFVSTVKGSGLYSVGNAFFGGVPVSAGDPPVMTVNGGHTFGIHTFDFSVFSPFFAVLRTCVVLAFCFISVRLLVVNK